MESTRIRAARSTEIPDWAEGLVRWLDSALAIPGTRIRFGFDALLGLFAPGAGDAVGAFATLAIFYLGFKLRVPKVILLRMLLNIGIDAVVGAVPIVGDIFDVFYRAGDKNLALLRMHGGTAGAAPAALDYAIVGLAFLTAIVLLSLPLVVGLGIVHVILRLSGN